MLPLFVVELVDGFQGATIDQARDEPCFVGGSRRQNMDAKIERHKQAWVELSHTLGGRLCLCLINHLHHIMIRFGDDAHLLDLRSTLFGEHEESQRTHRDLLIPQGPFPDGSPLKDQQLSALGFVFVCSWVSWGGLYTSKGLVWRYDWPQKMQSVIDVLAYGTAVLV